MPHRTPAEPRTHSETDVDGAEVAIQALPDGVTQWHICAHTRLSPPAGQEEDL